MKINQFNYNDSSIFLKKLLLSKKLKNIKTSTNITANQSKITNYTGINNSLSNLDTNISNKINFYSPQNIPKRNRINEELIKSANNILTQRMNNRKPPKIISYGLKKLYLDTSRKIALKNFKINLIKKKRIEINEKEMAINTSLLKISDKIEIDYKNFLNFVTKIKKEEKQNEEKLNKIKMIYDNTFNEYIKQLNVNKKLNENLVKEIKSICTFKKYGRN